MVGNDDFDLGFGKKVNDIFGSAIEFSMAPLAPKAKSTRLSLTRPSNMQELDLAPPNDCLNYVTRYDITP
jgi:hypothetical protein